MKTTNQIDREANERKAREIAEKIVGNNHYSYFDDFKQCALEAMQWKDKERKELWRITRNHYQEWAEEQIAKEKQKLIEKACEWLKKNMIGLDMGKYPMYSPNFINDFRKVMEE